ncbi:NADH-ubiquinone oxidoreductase-F iron-sulfur binding region domain-containing protein [Paraliomyxa miuraensis]|uniref:NADH-ubiquinone oxidoreductase-F iron-sulfur binding region domain-containing protein n=1 Tax=Paraliomyxa miuraensis TaxID=376150 RepID=UPI00224F768A|nr:NADH-ubiquinone oxidoreductase-F iron-sulfur binding region domain-containing protein [Paraliomyxa miuraensis]MCX4242395.1 NAD(P)H-dependent oxidoreductase subunit E [Paraliomyxa miuraensis]
MPTPTDDELIQRWRSEPAPLLPLLHAFHDRDGHLTDDALRAVAKGLRMPLADLFGTVTFYHHFARTPPGQRAPRVCDGPVCRLRGCDALLRALPDATPMPCAGRCDAPIPVLRGAELLVGTTAGGAFGAQGDERGWPPPEAFLRLEPSPLPPPYPGAAGDGSGECVFAEIRTPGRATLAGYRATGGYEALTAARSPSEIIDVITQSGLAGRGGAGFPTGRKWQAVADAPGDPKTIVCNADEGEPGCFKDRALMDHDPHALIEGMAIAARATGATRGFIYLRYEYPDTMVILERAIAEAKTAGLLDGFALCVRRGAGAYVCGEETSLLNSLEGKHPFPRNRPPYPVTHGYEDKPTVVNNVETLCAVAPILRHGATWYRTLGLGDHAGTKVISLSGDVVRPGNYEVPIGLPLRTLLDEWAGGPGPGRSVQAVTMAGLSGGLLGAERLDVTLDEPCLRSHGSFLGAGGIMVFDDTRDMVAVAHEAMAFFAHESCGKCFPCRIGTQRLSERLSPGPGGSGPTELDPWTTEVVDIGDAMKATSACGLGTAAPLITDSLLKYFPEQVARHLAARKA